MSAEFRPSVEERIEASAARAKEVSTGRKVAYWGRRALIAPLRVAGDLGVAWGALSGFIPRKTEEVGVLETTNNMATGYIYPFLAGIVAGIGGYPFREAKRYKLWRHEKIFGNQDPITPIEKEKYVYPGLLG